MAPVSPTVPGDEHIGQPASGDPSLPPAAYEGQPSFSTGAELLSNAEVAHEVNEAGNGGDDTPTWVIPSVWRPVQRWTEATSATPDDDGEAG